MLDSLYAAVARRRREWYAARPGARRRLRRPVISVGNIAAGGRGKTPFAAFLARELLAIGERPAILSRGYRRTDPADGAVVVRDAHGLRADVARAGDEPFMLARQLPGCIVVTSPDRYIGGRLAELHLGATVHILDDGFQHFGVDRDADIVLLAARDLTDRTLPGGRLREPLDVLVAADALVLTEDVDPPSHHGAVFRARRRTAPPVWPGRDGQATATVFVVSAIASPDAFLADVRARGFTVAGSRTFRDHHPFSSGDVDSLVAAARGAGAPAILTTEKDFVRLLPHRPFELPVGYLPLTIEVEPLDEFRAWLAGTLAETRDTPRA